ncbi:lipoprotein [Streptomyces sp. SID13726]|uniref:lipoprotein n=1 Tax=Streptomyces sp. SID13726 TaxID=2706058 RepID=UPI0013B74D65|nr:lipoprotein [Streptomyces sp. SID13726]NEB03688.1 hypothetical protein [Streptomyces sp. SID13726]
MLVRAGSAGHRLAHAALLAGVLTGCSEAAVGESETSARPSASAGTTVRSGGSIGAAGSACELPVTFDMAKGWKPEAVQAPLRQGPVSLVCEIDAKPAGSIGFLRVWAGESGGGDARSVLEGFVAGEEGASEERYSTFTSGALSGVRVEYLFTSELLDETKKESAFAVVTADGPVVLHLGGLDTEEHEEMLPAYELARRTLRTA